jgi:hypothetical protein
MLIDLLSAFLITNELYCSHQYNFQYDEKTNECVVKLHRHCLFCVSIECEVCYYPVFEIFSIINKIQQKKSVYCVTFKSIEYLPRCLVPIENSSSSSIASTYWSWPLILCSYTRKIIKWKKFVVISIQLRSVFQNSNKTTINSWQCPSIVMQNVYWYLKAYVQIQLIYCLVQLKFITDRISNAQIIST